MFLFVIFSFTFLLNTTTVLGYFEYQINGYQAQGYCGYNTITECETALKTTCGANTTATCIYTSLSACKDNAVEFSCPSEAVTVTGQTNSTSDDTYTLLAPIGGMETAPTNTGDYFNLIFKIAIGLCGVLAVVMIIVNGVAYMGEDSIFGKTEAKQKILAAILGLLIALGSYALLNTINPDLLKGNATVEAVYVSYDESVHGDTPQTAVNGKYCGGKYTANETWPSDTTERAQVVASGISVNNSNCTRVGQTGCTSLSGLDTGKVIALKKSCGSSCTVVITGGTECWLHSAKTTHVPGGNIVDLRISGLSSYLEKDSVVSYLKKWAGETNVPVYTKSGAVYIKESSHYHVKNW